MDGDPAEPGEEGRDEAAEAFEALRDEVTAELRALTTRVGQLAAAGKRYVPADYTPTLAAMNERLQAVTAGVERLGKHPALQLDPDAWAARVTAVETAATRQLGQDRHVAISEFRSATQDLRGALGSVVAADVQHKRLLQVGGVAFAAGVLVWAVVAGPLSRGLPQSWGVPETMAADTLGMDRWGAGARMMASGDPARWDALVHASDLVNANQDTIQACQQLPRSRGRVRCTIAVTAEGDGFGRLPGH